MSVRTRHRLLAVTALIQALTFASGQTSASLVIGAPNTPVIQNFNGLTTASSLPSLNAGGWRTWTTFEPPTFAGGHVSPTLIIQTTTLDQNSGTGTYSFRAGETTDRALGSIWNSAAARSIMVEVKNDTGLTISSFATAWNLEKYRQGESSMSVSFFHGNDGVTWIGGATSDVHYPDDQGYAGFSAPITTTKTATIAGLNVTSGSNYYFRWQFSRTGDSDLTAAVGLDDFSVTATSISAVPEGSAFLAAGVAGLISWLASRTRRRG